MFYKIIFLTIFISFFSFNINSKELINNELTNEELYNNDLNDLLLNNNNFEFKSENINKLYENFKSKTFTTNISEKPLYVVFNQDFDNVEISINDKIYIQQNKNKNFFLPPNIIHLSSMHNKSFAYSLHLDDFYKGLSKKYAQHILLFHELGHFFLEHHSDYLTLYTEEQLNKKGSYLKSNFDESFSDLYGLVLLVKYYNIEKEEVKEIFKPLSFYRKKYLNFKYKGSQSIDSFYNTFMLNYDDIIKKSDIEIGHYIFKINKELIN